MKQNTNAYYGIKKKIKKINKWTTNAESKHNNNLCYRFYKTINYKLIDFSVYWPKGNVHLQIYPNNIPQTTVLFS